MTRTRIISTTAIASLLGAALPAFAQAPAPAPMYAPAPAPAPMMAPAPAPMPAAEAGVMPAAPIVAPRLSDDMTGSVGFGVGVNAGTNDLIKPDTGNLMMKYWMSDGMALVPRLNFALHHEKGGTTDWAFSPAALAQFTLLKGASTRLEAGAGLGLSFAKRMAPANTTLNTDTYVAIFVPVELGVEHFFTRWFAMGVAAGFNLITFQKQGTPWSLDLAINNVNYLGSLFFYTD